MLLLGDLRKGNTKQQQQSFEQKSSTPKHVAKRCKDRSYRGFFVVCYWQEGIRKTNDGKKNQIHPILQGVQRSVVLRCVCAGRCVLRMTQS